MHLYMHNVSQYYITKLSSTITTLLLPIITSTFPGSQLFISGGYRIHPPLHRTLLRILEYDLRMSLPCIIFRQTVKWRKISKLWLLVDYKHMFSCYNNICTVFAIEWGYVCIRLYLTCNVASHNSL